MMLFPEAWGELFHLKRGQDSEAVPDLETQLVPPGFALLIGRNQPFGIEHVQLAIRFAGSETSPKQKRLPVW
jgi:hypothetical protein